MATLSESSSYRTPNASDPEAVAPPAGVSGPDLRMEELQYMVRNLQIYLAPCVAVVGLVSNVLGVFAVSRRPMLKFSTSHYVIAVLVCDALQLAGVLQSWLNQFGWHLFFVGGWCQFSTFADDVARFTSSWCLVALALDRAVCVRCPGAEPRFCLPWVARVVIVSVVVVATVVYFNISLLYAVVYVGERQAVCHALLAYAPTVERLGYADVFVNSLVPSLLVVSFAVVTLGQLLYDRRRDGSPTGAPRRRSLYAARPVLSQEEDADLSQERLVLALVFAFVALSLPYHAFRILDAVRSLRRTPTVVQRLHSYLIGEILVHLKYVQLALDTAVVLGCHKLIRRKFAEKCLCVRCPVRQDSGHELGYANRVSYDDLSNDESTIHIIRHEIQRSTATAL